MRFRPHRGSRQAAEAEAVDINDWQDVLPRLQAVFDDLRQATDVVERRMVRAEPYAWGSEAIVTVDDLGPFGFVYGLPSGEKFSEELAIGFVEVPIHWFRS